MSKVNATSTMDNEVESEEPKIPLIGIRLSGILQLDSERVIEASVETAIDVGYRFFDTAYMYLNEKPIGNALKRCIDDNKVRRDELFIVTKLPGIAMRPDRVEVFLRSSLANLQMDYVDLYLIHWPLGYVYNGDPNLIFPRREDGTLDIDMSTNLESIWTSMERMVDLGLTRQIGVSNFNETQIDRILNSSRIPITNLQVELNVHFQQPQLVNFCKSRRISVCAYAPLGSPGRVEKYKRRGLTLSVTNILGDETVVEIANCHSKTPAQIALRFLVQQGISVIPKSTKAHRLQSNFDISDFQLTKDQMQRLKELDKGPAGRSFDFSFAPEGREHPEFPF